MSTQSPYPCGYCGGKKLVCPLCKREVTISSHGDKNEISCKNPNCLLLSSGWGTWEEVLNKWKHWENKNV